MPLLSHNMLCTVLSTRSLPGDTKERKKHQTTSSGLAYERVEDGLCQADGAICGARWEVDEAIHNMQINLRECGGSVCAISTWLPIGSILPRQNYFHYQRWRRGWQYGGSAGCVDNTHQEGMFGDGVQASDISNENRQRDRRRICTCPVVSNHCPSSSLETSPQASLRNSLPLATSRSGYTTTKRKRTSTCTTILYDELLCFKRTSEVAKCRERRQPITVEGLVSGIVDSCDAELGSPTHDMTTHSRHDDPLTTWRPTHDITTHSRHDDPLTTWRPPHDMTTHSRYNDPLTTWRPTHDMTTHSRHNDPLTTWRSTHDMTTHSRHDDPLTI